MTFPGGDDRDRADALHGDLVAQARALASRTRLEILKFMGEACRPVCVSELQDHLGLNHNAVRRHLSVLLDAKLVEESLSPTGSRGRPPRTYRLAPGSARWLDPGMHERLAELLARSKGSPSRGRQEGRRVGRELAGRTPGSPEERLRRAMIVQGFDPVVERGHSTVRLVLGRCPFERAAVADPRTVCAIHLGLAEGLVEGGGRAVSLRAYDPRTAGCVLELAQARPS